VRLFWLLAACSRFLPAQTIVFQHVTVIDATGAEPQKNVSVLIAGDRIRAIDKRIRPPRDARVIEAKGKFLIPGLWDMHMHLGPPEIFFPLLVANGIIGVREMFTGIPMPTIRAWRARPDVPRIVAS
jgi:adenine deaminase